MDIETILARHRRAISQTVCATPTERDLHEAMALLHALLYGHDDFNEQCQIRDAAWKFIEKRHAAA